jgi:hypothetical protein
MLFVAGAGYIGVIYFMIVKPYFGQTINNFALKPVGRMFKQAIKVL